MELNGAQILIQELIAHGVTSVFGYPGGAVLDIYDELYKAEKAGRLKHYITAHEQGAVHAADGYARIAKKPGVAIATSGPGATNTITGIANAYLDNIPMVVITGNVPQQMLGKNSFQEVNIVGITKSITKKNYMVRDVTKLQETIREAFFIAKDGQKGPVLIDIPKDIQRATCEYNPDKQFEFGFDVMELNICHLLELVAESKRPLLYVGGGVVSADATHLVMELSDKLNAPITSSLMGLAGGYSNHKNFLGMLGMHGKHSANKIQSECDLMISLGARFSDRTTGNKEKFRCCKIIHVDVKRKEINKNIKADCALIGDVREILTQVLKRVNPRKPTDWISHAHKLKQQEFKQDEADRADYGPNYILTRVAQVVGPDTPVATDVGQHQMWTAQHYPHASPRMFITSGGLGTMGFGLGAAIGSSIAHKTRVVHVTSDGSFHMNLNELVTAVSYGLPILTILLDNAALGMVRQWQDIFYEGRRSQTVLGRKTDYVRLAQAFGAAAFSVSCKDELDFALTEAMKINDRPCVIHCLIDLDEGVFPMIPPNGSVYDIILKKRRKK